MDKLTPKYTQNILSEIDALPPDADAVAIEQTVDRLNAMNYQPLLLTDTPQFLTFTTSGLREYIQQLTQTQKDLSEQHLSLLLYHYKLLQRLRRDEPEAWDEINELMEDD